jgi:rod shape-determining protein MreC
MLLEAYDQKKSRSKLIVNVFFCIIFIFAALREDRLARDESAFDLFLIDTLAPIQKGLADVKHSLTDGVDKYIANVEARENLALLQQDFSVLKSRYFSLEQEILTIKTQSKIIDKYGSTSSNPILAKVISRDASSDYRMIRLNKGINDGVQIQSPVVTLNGLVGYIYRASDNFSDVLTILDSKAKIDGQVKRTNSLGIIEGTLGDFCSMKYLLRRDPISLDDLIVTSGLGNIFPAGIPIGYVRKIDKQSHGINQDVSIRPSVIFDKLTDVLILSRKLAPQHIDELKELDKK